MALQDAGCPQYFSLIVLVFSIPVTICPVKGYIEPDRGATLPQMF